MNIGEIVEFTARDVLGDRPREVSISDDSRALESTRSIQRLLDEAQDILALESYCLISREVTDETLFALANPTIFIQLPRQVIAILLATLEDSAGNKTVLCRASRGTPALFSGGRPRMYVTDATGTGLRMYLSPGVTEAGLTLRLVGARYPVIRFVPPPGETTEARKVRENSQCEIPLGFHERLTDYVLMRSTTRRDIDQSALGESSEAAKRWDRTIKDLRFETERQNTADKLVFSNPQF